MFSSRLLLLYAPCLGAIDSCQRTKILREWTAVTPYWSVVRSDWRAVLGYLTLLLSCGSLVFAKELVALADTWWSLDDESASLLRPILLGSTFFWWAISTLLFRAFHGEHIGNYMRENGYLASDDRGSSDSCS